MNGRRVWALGAALVAASTAPATKWAGTIQVTDTGAASATTCTVAQAIYAANLANNPANATPAGVTTVMPLSDSATTTTGSCNGAGSGANTIDLTAVAGRTLTFSAADNYWYGPNVLPPIASTIVIEGQGATLSVMTGVGRLRFFFIGADANSSATPGYNTPGPGNLTLHRLRLTGGRQQGGNAALREQPGL
ncbi:hypothetical protein [Dokdonella soli]|uniref:Spore coat protein U domain-containing protein n=1 Tax=Dokdonella soli TaxID=529810 RepID=A0ABP3TLU5_9GAMM